MFIKQLLIDFVFYNFNENSPTVTIAFATSKSIN